MSSPPSSLHHSSFADSSQRSPHRPPQARCANSRSTSAEHNIKLCQTHNLTPFQTRNLKLPNAKDNICSVWWERMGEATGLCGRLRHLVGTVDEHKCSWYVCIGGTVCVCMGDTVCVLQAPCRWGSLCRRVAEASVRLLASLPAAYSRQTSGAAADVSVMRHHVASCERYATSCGIMWHPVTLWDIMRHYVASCGIL